MIVTCCFNSLRRLGTAAALILAVLVVRTTDVVAEVNPADEEHACAPVGRCGSTSEVTSLLETPTDRLTTGRSGHSDAFWLLQAALDSPAAQSAAYNYTEVDAKPGTSGYPTVDFEQAITHRVVKSMASMLVFAHGCSDALSVRLGASNGEAGTGAVIAVVLWLSLILLGLSLCFLATPCALVDQDHCDGGGGGGTIHLASAHSPCQAILPPPLCPNLLLPSVEARFVVSVNGLASIEEVGYIEVYSLAGEVLLYGHLQHGPNGMALNISLTHPGTTPKATVGPPGWPTAPGTFEICGPHGVHYGMLTPSAEGIYTVLRDGQTLLSVDGGDAGLEMAMFCPSGSQVATVQCGVRDATMPFAHLGLDHLEIRSVPGMDAILVLTCVLGVLLFLSVD